MPTFTTLRAIRSLSLPDSEQAKRRAVQLAPVRISTCAASPWRPRRRADMAHAARAITASATTDALATRCLSLGVARARAPLHDGAIGLLIARGTADARGRPRTHRTKASAGAIDTARGAAAVIERRRRSGGYARRRSGTAGRRCAAVRCSDDEHGCTRDCSRLAVPDCLTVPELTPHRDASAAKPARAASISATTTASTGS